MNLYEGIFERQSIRHYRMETIDTKIIEHILNYANHLENLPGSYPTAFKILNWQSVKKKLTGAFHVKAPYYLVLFSENTQEAMLNAGCLLGHLDLYMVSKGLGTCFFSSGKHLCKKENGLEPIMCIAFGKAQSQVYRNPKQAKRLPFSELYTVKEAIGEEQRCIVEAARLAPSSFNSQPWRLVIYDGRIHLFCKKQRVLLPGVQKLHSLDMGIILAYLFIGAEEFWYSPEAVKLENISEKQFKRNQYVITLKIK